jgi:hypothetical protein
MIVNSDKNAELRKQIRAKDAAGTHIQKMYLGVGPRTLYGDLAPAKYTVVAAVIRAE